MTIQEAIKEARKEFGAVLYNDGSITWDYDNLIDELSIYEDNMDYYLLDTSIVVVDDNGFLADTVYIIEGVL